MDGKRLGELTEQELTGMMDSVLSDGFDPRPAHGRQMPASEFFETSKARRINKTKAASSAPETSEIRSLIMNEFAQWHANDGALETAIPGFILFRYSAPTEPASLFFEPRISVTLQGTKRVVLGDEEYVYGESQFILTSVDVPVVAQVVEATREKPYSCVLLKLDLEMARQMISDFETPVTDSILPRYGVSTGPAPHELLDAIYRLLRLLSTPSDIPNQKHLRLHEARRLMLAGTCDAGGAAFEMGYESRSQFTREYRRLFGEPPMRNIKSIKGVV